MELLPKYLEYPKNPIHLANMGTRYNLDGKNEYFLGGVLSINSEDFTKSNGYPNNFWGWGGEDDVLSSRLRLKNINIEKPKESVIDLEEMTWDEKNIILKQNKYKEMQKWEKSCKDNNILYEKYKKHCKNITNRDTYKKNGINNIKKLFSITDRNDNDNVSHIKVYLNIDENDTPKSDTSSHELTPDLEPPVLDEVSSDKLLDDKISDDVIVEGSKVKWSLKGKEFSGKVVKFTEKRDKCRICCKPGKTITDSGAFYMVKVEELTLIKDTPESSPEKEPSPEREPSPEQKQESDDIIVGSKVEFTLKDKKIVGIVEKVTPKKFKICCKPGKNSGDKNSLYMIDKDIVKLIKE